MKLKILKNVITGAKLLAKDAVVELAPKVGEKLIEAGFAVQAIGKAGKDGKGDESPAPPGGN